MSERKRAKGVRPHARGATTRPLAEEGSRSEAEAKLAAYAAYRAEARARRLRDMQQ